MMACLSIGDSVALISIRIDISEMPQVSLMNKILHMRPTVSWVVPIGQSRESYLHGLPGDNTPMFRSHSDAAGPISSTI